MKGLIVLLVGFLLGSCGSSSGGGGNAQALCMQGSDAICGKVFDCAEGEPLRAEFGTSKADCISTLNMDCTATPCESGQTYHADMAQACVTALQAVQCSALAGDPLAIFPAPCLQICTGGTP
jgi:hypothetical protein